MDFKYKQLEQELSALSKVFSELGVRLSEVAKEVTAQGVNPSEKLIEQISTTRASFESVRSAIHGHATAMLVSPLPKLGELVSIATIDSLFKASAVAEENKFSIEAEREKALAILGRALSIIHRETADFKPLQECHAKIGELRNAVLNVVWPHRHPEAESIIGMKHPATAFIHFVENLDHLDDDRWMALETTITESYGKPLFVAASRGKLALAPDSKPEAQPAASKPAAVPAEPAKPAPAPAAEKPVEKKIVAEKPAPAPVAPAPTVAPAAPPAVSVEKKPAPAPVAAPAAPAPAAPAVADKAPQKPSAPPAATPATHSAPVVPIQATPVATPEKKPVQTVPAPAPTAHPAPAASTPAAPHAVPATPAPAAATASVPPTPVAAPAPSAPVAAAPVALPRPPAPAPPAAATPPAPPAASTPVPAAPAAAASNATPAAASPLAVSINSLSALATATEPAEKKPVSAPADALDKQRKEPRLATPTPQPAPKPEAKPQEVSEAMQPETVQQGMGGDGSQRPQRWGFWRGNR